ncbi:hypothetical protein T484DRAFT_1850862 [Baffinella frigidus]|nr:hypothetical protein T484DRAFT_1850862 [Cryptophyta sp. CCMP2293]
MGHAILLALACALASLGHSAATGVALSGVWGGSDGAARRESAVSAGPVGGMVAGAMRLRGGGAVQLFEIKVC